MDKDIIALLFKIKNNINIIESGKEDQPLLDLVRDDFFEMIEYIKLFLISERDSYYGYFLMNMRFCVDFYSKSVAGIKLNTFPPTFETNPLLLCKYNIKEILYFVCHEIDHVVFNHPAEMVKCNPTNNQNRFLEFNLAADAAVNDRIDFEIVAENHNFLSHPEGVITSSYLSKKFELGPIRSMENFAYYFSLIQGKVDENCDNNSPGENGQDKSGTEDSSEHVVTEKSCSGNYEDHNWEAGDDAEDVTATIKEFVNISVDMMSNETRGLMPARFINQVNKLNEPAVLPWQKVLKKYVGTITAGKRKTRTRLNRRQPNRFDISGKEDDKVLKIVVAIDTSASVNDAMISKIFNEIFEIIAKRKHDITIIECDSKVQRVYKAKSVRDIQTKIAGRGGTAFSPVIDYINNERYYRDALLIYFTDGYGELEIPRPKTYRNIWVVIGNKKNLSLKEPYGIVLDF